MTRFLEDAIARSGLMPLLAAKRVGDLDTVRAQVAVWSRADLLVLGAIADLVRDAEVGDVVRIHGDREGANAPGTMWVDVPSGTSELEVLRAVAVARIASARGTRVGIDFAEHGLELAQVALGFGATDLRGALSRKSGLPIFDDEALKVKGEGMVDLKSLKKRELAKLVTHAGRVAVFVEDESRAPTTTVPTRNDANEAASAR